MPTLHESFESLDAMVANHAATPEIRNQIAYLDREVAALYAEHLSTVNAYNVLKLEHEQLKTAQSKPPSDAPNWGSQPRIKGRMEQ